MPVWLLNFVKWLAEKVAINFLGTTLDNAWKRFDLWLAYLKGKKAGAQDQRMRDAEGARAAEQEMAEIAGERRDSAETRRRLDDGSF